MKRDIVCPRETSAVKKISFLWNTKWKRIHQQLTLGLKYSTWRCSALIAMNEDQWGICIFFNEEIKLLYVNKTVGLCGGVNSIRHERNTYLGKISLIILSLLFLLTHLNCTNVNVVFVEDFRYDIDCPDPWLRGRSLIKMYPSFIAFAKNLIVWLPARQHFTRYMYTFAHKC